MQKVKHATGEQCPSCTEKLKSAHPTICSWFLDLKKTIKDVHISCAYRGEREQNEAHAMGKSNVSYPNSKHNKADATGLPCSEALDLFQLASNGMAVWAYSYFKQINDLNEKACEPVLWGGNFKGEAKKLGDFSHFELK